jgi:hypothetical protein
VVVVEAAAVAALVTSATSVFLRSERGAAILVAFLRK